jgi:hypothetical protein
MTDSFSIHSYNYHSVKLKIEDVPLFEEKYFLFLKDLLPDIVLSKENISFDTLGRLVVKPSNDENYNLNLLNKKLITLKEIPEQYRTQLVCETAVLIDGKNIKHVPKELLSKEIYLSAIKTYPFIKIPSQYCDDTIVDNMIKIASSIKEEGYSYRDEKYNFVKKYFPRDFLTQERANLICEKIHANNILYIPNKFYTEEIWKIVMSYGFYWLCEHLPKKFRTYEYYELAISKEPLTFFEIDLPDSQNTKNFLTEEEYFKLSNILHKCFPIGIKHHIYYPFLNHPKYSEKINKLKVYYSPF